MSLILLSPSNMTYFFVLIFTFIVTGCTFNRCSFFLLEALSFNDYLEGYYLTYHVLDFSLHLCTDFYHSQILAHCSW